MGKVQDYICSIIGETFGPKTEEEAIDQLIRSHRSQREIIQENTESYEDIFSEFRNFDLDSHIRGCMSLAMDAVEHDTAEYYCNIRYIYATLDAHAEELLFVILLNKIDNPENIWLWSAIGELKSIKRVLDGEDKNE